MNNKKPLTGFLLKEVRELRGLTQHAAAKEMGVTLSELHDWESRNDEPLLLRAATESRI